MAVSSRLKLWIAFSFFGMAIASPAATLISSTSSTVLGGSYHECYRTCVAGETMTCYYEFTVAEYMAMSAKCDDCPYTRSDCFNQGCITAGGDDRLVTTVNYMLPGPSIQVCLGDIVQVNVTNALVSDTTSVHWHGLTQKGTPYMDGVPYVSQCPILPGQTFLYNFTAEPAGTHLYHGHSGVQEDDGLYGAIIIRKPVSEEPNGDLYDYDLPEHVIAIWHWYQYGGANAMSKAIFTEGRSYGYSYTVNGMAATVTFTDDDDIDYKTPLANFTVASGYRYRFRVMANTPHYCPVQFSIDGHNLTMIALDGKAVEPFEVESMILNAADRYDFVLNADQEAQSYWIKLRGLGVCGEDGNPISAVAPLYYEDAGTDDPTGSTEYADTARSGALFNPVTECNTVYPNNTLIRLADVPCTDTDVQDVSGDPDYQYFIPFAINRYTGYEFKAYYAQVNNASWLNLPIPFNPQRDQITSDMYCTENDISAMSCSNSYCTCPFVYEAAVDSLVEICLVDISTTIFDDHPFHVHGMNMRIVAQGYFNSSTTVDEVKALDEAGSIVRNLDDPPAKDTFGVPAQGYLCGRFIADNPGYWFLHCHIAAHLEEGMAIVLKIGEHSDMPETPSGMPTCSAGWSIV